MNLDLMNSASAIAAGYLSRNHMDADDVPAFIEKVANTVSAISAMAEDRVHSTEPTKRPAVPIEESVRDDSIVCLEDGRPLKYLRRYLRERFSLSPDEYRERWNLPGNYPMVAPASSRRRSEIARDINNGYRRPD